MMLKARFGVSSLGCEIVRDETELVLAHELLERRLVGNCPGNPNQGILIQNYLEGQEYGLDVVNDLEGRYVATFIRCKHRMRAGMTDRATTLEDSRFEKLGRKLGEELRHIGILDCDVFLSGGEIWVLDLNPRIGGGYPFSHKAGADFPSTLVAWLEGGVPDPDWLRPRPNIMSSRGDVIEIVEQGMDCASLLRPGGRLPFVRNEPYRAADWGTAVMAQCPESDRCHECS